MEKDDKQSNENLPAIKESWLQDDLPDEKAVDRWLKKYWGPFFQNDPNKSTEAEVIMRLICLRTTTLPDGVCPVLLIRDHARHTLRKENISPMDSDLAYAGMPARASLPCHKCIHYHEEKKNEDPPNRLILPPKEAEFLKKFSLEETRPIVDEKASEAKKKEQKRLGESLQKTGHLHTLIEFRRVGDSNQIELTDVAWLTALGAIAIEIVTKENLDETHPLDDGYGLFAIYEKKVRQMREHGYALIQEQAKRRAETPPEIHMPTLMYDWEVRLLDAWAKKRAEEKKQNGQPLLRQDQP